MRNEGYGRYEELLLLRDRLKKDANLYYATYIREFGDLINSVYEMKISCIEKKKMIGYCQSVVNHGGKVETEKLQAYIEEEMKEYKLQLEGMLKETKAAKEAKDVKEADILKIKKIYRELAKLIHPDINPKTNEIPQLQELWMAIVTAYHCNSLNDMEAVEVLVRKALKDMGNDIYEIEIPDLEEKIKNVEKEIHEIKTTDPYCFREILEDSELFNNKKKELNEELKTYTDYFLELDKIMEQLVESGVVFLWRMN